MEKVFHRKPAKNEKYAENIVDASGGGGKKGLLKRQGEK